MSERWTRLDPNPFGNKKVRVTGRLRKHTIVLYIVNTVVPYRISIQETTIKASLCPHSVFVALLSHILWFSHKQNPPRMYGAWRRIILPRAAEDTGPPHVLLVRRDFLRVLHPLLSLTTNLVWLPTIHQHNMPGRKGFACGNRLR